jgi:hypothetical protein
VFSERTDDVLSVLDALIRCAVGNSKHTGCLKSQLKLEFQQHKCRTVTKVRRPWIKNVCASVEGWLRHCVNVERKHFVRLKWSINANHRVSKFQLTCFVQRLLHRHVWRRSGRAANKVFKEMEENGGSVSWVTIQTSSWNYWGKLPKILSLNRGSGWRCEPRITQIRIQACYHSTWPFWYSSAYSIRGSSMPSSSDDISDGDVPQESDPRLLKGLYCPYLYPRRYYRAAIMSWSATLCQQCMWAFPGSCHHVTNPGRNIPRWLWRLCSSWLEGGWGRVSGRNMTRPDALY